MRQKYPSPNALSIKYFWTPSYNHWVVLGITELSNPQLHESGMSKKGMEATLIIYNLLVKMSFIQIDKTKQNI